jgi:hypothetical protein
MKDKILASTIKWVNGVVNHNCKSVNDECLPDFSCCNPEMFEQDINKRMASLAMVIDNVRYSKIVDKELNQ